MSKILVGYTSRSGLQYLHEPGRGPKAYVSMAIHKTNDPDSPDEDDYSPEFIPIYVDALDLNPE